LKFFSFPDRVPLQTKRREEVSANLPYLHLEELQYYCVFRYSPLLYFVCRDFNAEEQILKVAPATQSLL
jgi:hypothetical protein